MDDNHDLGYTHFDRFKAFLHSYRLAIISFALASLVIAAYVYKFAPGSNGSWATETEEWARFGEYVGGFFGVFAFVGVLMSTFLGVTPATTRGVLQEAAKASESDDIDQLLMPTILAAELGPLIKNNAAIVGPELDLLAECLDDAVVRGGSGAIFQYYRTKYRPIVLRMKVMGYEPKSVTFWI
jgi:hypothetical protein